MLRRHHFFIAASASSSDAKRRFSRIPVPPLRPVKRIVTKPATFITTVASSMKRGLQIKYTVSLRLYFYSINRVILAYLHVGSSHLLIIKTVPNFNGNKFRINFVLNKMKQRQQVQISCLFSINYLSAINFLQTSPRDPARKSLIPMFSAENRQVLHRLLSVPDQEGSDHNPVNFSNSGWVIFARFAASDTLRILSLTRETSISITPSFFPFSSPECMPACIPACIPAL